MLLCLFTSFIVGIVFRYLFRNPQPWTYELSTIAFVQFAILSSCYVQRQDEHIVFDMIYEKMSSKTKCCMRIIGGILIVFAATLLIPASIKYVSGMFGLSTQIIKWPRWVVFACFPVVFFVLDVRTIRRLVLDCISYREKDYGKRYPVRKGEEKA